MIADVFLNLVYVFVLLIVSVLNSFGTVSENNSLTESLVPFKGYYMSLDTILPIPTIIAIVAFVLTFEGFYLLYKLVRWGYKKIPGIG